MPDAIRVLLLGTGQMGSEIARIVLSKQGLELVGAYARRRERQGQDLGPLIGLEHDIGLAVHTELAQALDAARPRIAIQASCSRLDDAWEELAALLQRGISVISIAEELACPAAGSPARAAELDAMARRHRAAVLGTGVNPGFVLDLLVIALSGVCSELRSITATRVNDLSPYGPSVLSTQGVGLSPAAYREGQRNGSVVGHFGFAESIHMIGASLGWEFDRVEQHCEAIISSVRRETPFVVVEPGQVAGSLHRATAWRAGQAAVTLLHPQQVHPQLEGIETGDCIEIDGSPKLCWKSTPEIPGGHATAALAVNMIPPLLAARPGLYTMAELPVPAAILGDARSRFAHPAAEQAGD